MLESEKNKIKINNDFTILMVTDDQFVRRFLHCCDHSLERTKNLLDLCYTVRSQAPELFANRDPTSSAIQNILKIT